MIPGSCFTTLKQVHVYMFSQFSICSRVLHAAYDRIKFVWKIFCRFYMIKTIPYTTAMETKFSLHSY